MKRPQPLPPTVLPLVLVLGLSWLSATSGGASRSSSKVDLEQAKAELAKAKNAPTVQTASPTDAPEPGDTSKPARKFRLFGRDKTPAPSPSEAVPPAESPLTNESDAGSEEVQPTPDKPRQPQEPKTKQRRLFPKLFKRDPGSESSVKDLEPGSDPNPAEPTSEDEPSSEVIEVEAEVVEKRNLLQRLSPFARSKNQHQTEGTTTVPSSPGGAEDVPSPDPETSIAQDAPEPAESGTEPGRERLLGRLFAKKAAPDEQEAEREEADPAADVEPEPATEPEETVPSPDEKLAEQPAGERRRLFGWFRKPDAETLTKADKTKLGKTIESEPAKPSKGLLAKKSSESEALGWYVITEADTPFYAIGPGQPMPPEKILDRGSMLTVTKGGWGWCNVKLDSGDLGVISSKAMRPATVAEVSRHTRGMATASKSRPSRSLFNFLGRGPAPTLDLPESSGQEPIRNFGLLPPAEPGE